MSRRDWALFVDDIQQAYDKISGYVSGMSFEDFCADTRTVDAVVLSLSVIWTIVQTDLPVLAQQLSSWSNESR